MSLRRTVTAVLGGTLLAVGATGCGGAAAKVVPVDVSATPPGWVPVPDGNVQISVPRGWAVLHGSTGGCVPGAPGVVLVDGPQWCTASMGLARPPSVPTVTMSLYASGGPARIVGRARRVHGLEVIPLAGDEWLVPAGRLVLAVHGEPTDTVLATLTTAPRLAVLVGRSKPVPASWHWISHAGVRFAVPPSWPVSTHYPPCHSTDFVLGEAGVVLAPDSPPPAASCPPTASAMSAAAPVDGIWVLPFRNGAAAPCDATVDQYALQVCVTADPHYAVLVLVVREHGGRRLTVELGMSGTGATANSVLNSLRPG